MPSRKSELPSIPVAALFVVVEFVLDHADHNLIADESSFVHDLLGCKSKGCPRSDLRAQHVSGGLPNISAVSKNVSGRNTKWQAQNFSLIFGAWVPFPARSFDKLAKLQIETLESA
jgi:hypothetical protein